MIGNSLAAQVSRLWKGYAQGNSRTSRPNAHALSLLDHNDHLAPGGVTERLNHFEHHRIAQGRVLRIKTALAHHPFGQFSRRQLAILPQMKYAKIGNLTLFAKAMTDHVTRA